MDDKKKNKHIEGMNYSVSLGFERAYLPPFRDILVIGKRCSLGANGVSRSLELLVPNGFIMHDTEHSDVAALIINRTILKRITAKKILEILEARVFPYMSDDEIIKVNFDIMIRYDNFDVDPR